MEAGLIRWAREHPLRAIALALLALWVWRAGGDAIRQIGVSFSLFGQAQVINSVGPNTTYRLVPLSAGTLTTVKDPLALVGARVTCGCAGVENGEFQCNDRGRRLFQPGGNRPVTKDGEFEYTHGQSSGDAVVVCRIDPPISPG